MCCVFESCVIVGLSEESLVLRYLFVYYDAKVQHVVSINVL